MIRTVLRLIFIIETDPFCEVGTEFMSITEIYFPLKIFNTLYSHKTVAPSLFLLCNVLVTRRDAFTFIEILDGNFRICDEEAENI
jgi:hypothetical protein